MDLHRIEDGRHVVGERGGQVHFLAREGVGQVEHVGVEGLAVEGGLAAGLLARAVDLLADDRVARLEQGP